MFVWRHQHGWRKMWKVRHQEFRSLEDVTASSQAMFFITAGIRGSVLQHSYISTTMLRFGYCSCFMKIICHSTHARDSFSWGTTQEAPTERLITSMNVSVPRNHSCGWSTKRVSRFAKLAAQNTNSFNNCWAIVKFRPGTTATSQVLVDRRSSS